LLHQLGDIPHRFVDHRGDGWVGVERLIEDAIQQVLNSPRQFTEQQPASHTAAALEGMEHATDGDERIVVLGIIPPSRETFVQRLQDFLGLIDEDIQDLLVELITKNRNLKIDAAPLLGERHTQVIRRAGCRWRLLGARVAGRLRCRSRRCLRARRRIGARRRHRRFSGFIRGRCRAGLATTRDAKAFQALRSNVEDCIGAAAPVANTFQVVFNTCNGIGEVVQRLSVRHCSSAKHLVDVTLRPRDQLISPIEFGDGQGTAHPFKRASQAIQMRDVPVFQELDEPLFDTTHFGDRLGDRRPKHLPILSVEQDIAGGTGIIVMVTDPSTLDELSQGGFHIKEGFSGFFNGNASAGAARTVLRNDIGLFADDAPRFCKPNNAKRVGNTAHRFSRFRQRLGMFLTAPHVEIERVLDRGQVFANRVGHTPERRCTRAEEAFARLFEAALLGDKLWQTECLV